ncbi:MAG: carboxymuconolactone decarboxylase family protein [Phycisphaerales bacterium]
MARINPVTKAQATGKSGELLGAVEKKLGRVPNLLGTLAHSPAALGSYLAQSEAVGQSSLSAKAREQIALAIAGVNQCGYCASAHTAIGKSIGLSADDAGRALRGEADDPLTQGAIDLAKVIVEKRGLISDDDLRAARAAGLGDREVIEVVALVALNIFTNYANHVSGTEIDFPVVELPEPAGV